MNIFDAPNQSELCHDGSRRVWSLWEIMTNFNLPWFMQLYNDLLAVRYRLTKEIENGNGGAPLDSARLHVITELVAKMGTFFHAQKMIDGYGTCSKQLQIISNTNRIDASGTRGILDSLVGSLQQELNKYYFAEIGKDWARIVDDARAMGVEVSMRFPDAGTDIASAATCFSVGCYTASVFHVMRVSEHGLRQLAKKLRVSISDKGKKIPYDHGTWDKVITGCQNKIDNARRLAGPKKTAQLNLYSEAAQHCSYMKDIYRNDVSHARRPYVEHEALNAFNRVKDFMNFLDRVLMQ